MLGTMGRGRVGGLASEAGNAGGVVGLVYVAAFTPDKGESVSTLMGGGQQPPVQPSADGFLFFDAAIFPQAFAQDVARERGAFLAAAQVPTAAAAFATPLSQAAWRNKPSFYVIGTHPQTRQTSALR